MTVEFTTEASRDLFGAVDYYESKEKGLGKRFAREIERLVRVVSEEPLLWRPRPGGYRRANCPVFPFYLAFVVEAEVIVVVAVAHANRRPGFWHDRLE